MNNLVIKDVEELVNMSQQSLQIMEKMRSDILIKEKIIKACVDALVKIAIGDIPDQVTPAIFAAHSIVNIRSMNHEET